MAEEFNAGNVDAEKIVTTQAEAFGDNSSENNISTNADNTKTEKKIERPDPSTLNVDEDGIIEYITPDMIIGDIITMYPDASLVLMKCGMHCISCGVSQFESLAEACAVHGLYTDDVAKVVNDYLTQTLGDKKED